MQDKSGTERLGSRLHETIVVTALAQGYHTYPKEVVSKFNCCQVLAKQFYELVLVFNYPGAYNYEGIAAHKLLIYHNYP